MKNEISRTIEMQCPTCGCDLFETEPENEIEQEIVTCANCNRSFSREELISENRENISEHITELSEEAIKELKKELEKSFKKVFRK